jgi:hypothetical protein
MIKQIKDKILSIDNIDEKIDFINQLRAAIHEVSPFKDNPVDFVTWIKND